MQQATGSLPNLTDGYIMQNRNMASRRNFLRVMGFGGLAAMTGFSLKSVADAGLKKVTILHTNDTHSRIDPYPAGDPNFPGMGGYARRAALVNYIRDMDQELLLLDAGDFFQGTPYYNMYGGELELKLMSKMGYDAATVGNHEFDNGLDGFLSVLPFADFPFITANLDFSDTILRGKTIPYKVFRKKGLRIGIYGLGIDPKGLVSRDLYGETRYLDPVEVARDVEETLKQKENCDLIICLSHLGYAYEHGRISDVRVAAHTQWTDIIIGGHTHTLLDPPAVVANSQGMPVTIGQTGSGGVRLGVMNVYFEEATGQKIVESYTTKISQKQEA